MESTQNHDVCQDRVGLNNRPRYSCYTCGGKAIVCQPWMNMPDWQEEKDRFFADHPHLKLKEAL